MKNENTQMALRDVSGSCEDFFKKLLSEEGGQWLSAFKKFLRKENPWEAVVSALLDFIGTVKILSTGKFIVGDNFTIDSKKVKIAWIQDNFRNNFSSKVEKAQAETTLNISKLKKNSLDALIITELGSATETTLANIWELLKKQPKGESGKLLTNSYANIFYVRDVKGVLWAVDVRWFGDGWYVFADSVADPDRWFGDSRVFSRNS